MTDQRRSELVEIVARAMAVAHKTNPDDNSALCGEPIWKSWIDDATAALDALTAAGVDLEGWRDIESAPKDGTPFAACNADHPEWGSWTMVRRVIHRFGDGGLQSADRNAWLHLQGIEPDYQEGHDRSEPEVAIAPDEFNSSVSYLWRPLPTPPKDKTNG